MAARHLLAAAAALLPLLGCQMPARGTPVFVDMRAGRFWNGEGLLLEVNPEQTRCRVAVRDRALIVREFWTDCAHVHALTVREGTAPSSSLR
jgi:hypothetical protein